MSDTNKIIEKLRDKYGKIYLMEPTEEVYIELLNTLDKASDDALMAVYKARIKWASSLAFNRMVARKIIC